MARRSSSDHERLIALERCAIVVLGMYLAGTGIHALGSGGWTYLNYVRSPVAAPIAIIIGVALIVAGFVMRR